MVRRSCSRALTMLLHTTHSLWLISLNRLGTVVVSFVTKDIPEMCWPPSKDGSGVNAELIISCFPAREHSPDYDAPFPIGRLSTRQHFSSRLHSWPLVGARKHLPLARAPATPLSGLLSKGVLGRKSSVGWLRDKTPLAPRACYSLCVPPNYACNAACS